jgi:hypothetical protein
MNSINASIGFSNFQIRLDVLRVLSLPLCLGSLHQWFLMIQMPCVRRELIVQLQTDVAEAKDNLFQAKVFQTYYANQNRSPEIPFRIGDKVMLSTLHRRQEFKKKGKKRAAKFFPRYDGPYDIIDVHTETSNYTLELPNSLNTYPTYHASELKAFLANDATLFPTHELSQPRPIVTPDGLEEYLVQEIIDSR